MRSTITQSLSEKLDGGGQGWDLQVADLCFRIRRKWPKNAILGAIWVPRMSMEGSICIGINLNDKQTLFIMVQCVLYPITGRSDLFLGPKHRKIGLEKHPFRIPFQVAPLRVVFYWHGLHWAPWWRLITRNGITFEPFPHCHHPPMPHFGTIEWC